MSAGTARSNQGAARAVPRRRRPGGRREQRRPPGPVRRWTRTSAGRRRLDFYPVNLESRFVTAHIETTRPGWAVLHAVGHALRHAARHRLCRQPRPAHRLHGRREFAVVRGGGRHRSVQHESAAALVLDPGQPARRHPAAGLEARAVQEPAGLDRSVEDASACRSGRPAASRCRAACAGWSRPTRASFGFDIRGEQLWATYQLRDLQLEFGWESFDSVTSFGNVHDRRIYIRVRRDLLFMR